MNRELYPQNWDAIARKIKDDADWCCEECGRPCKRPSEIHTKFRDRLRGSDWITQLYEGGTVPRFGRFTLTVAHLDHNPANCDRANLRALCAPCHLRYDAEHHGKNAARTRISNRVSPGQLSLPFNEPVQIYKRHSIYVYQQTTGRIKFAIRQHSDGKEVAVGYREDRDRAIARAKQLIDKWEDPENG